MNTRDASGDERPWYRHIWVWLLMVPPAATVVFWIVVIWTTAASPSLVVDDYSKIGLTYEQQRERDLTAARLGVSARLHALRETGGLTLVLRGLERPPARLELLLAHPAEAARDIRVTLERDGAGVYRSDLGRQLLAGRRVEVTPPGGAWRLTGRLTPGQSEVALAAPGTAREP